MSKGSDLRHKILQKYGTVSRFAVLSGLPYHTIQNACRFSNDRQIENVEKFLDRTRNRATKCEVSEETRKKIHDKLLKIDPQLNDRLYEWCKKNGIYRSYILTVLKGEVKFKNFRVRRLMSLLKIEE